MQFRLFYGPDKTRIEIKESTPQNSDGQIPFHGIIPRGLLQSMKSYGYPPYLWYRYAHKLLDPAAGIKNAEFDNLQQLAHECQVLSWTQSAKAVEVYVTQLTNESGMNSGIIEAWNIKEGHTSSVWKIKVDYGAGQEDIALNVSRDHKSGLELTRTMNQLKILQTAYPELSVARVLSIGSIHPEGFPGKVTITKNEWIANAFEIHERLNRFNGEKEYLLVERFLTHPGNPVYITSVRGRIFNKQESRIIREYYDKVLSEITGCMSYPARIKINEGDMIWCKNQPIVIALS